MNDNPYATPASDVGGDAELRRSIWWKIYFFIIVALTVFGYLSLFSSPGAGYTEYLSAAVSIVSLLGLFGYVFCRTILRPGFWLAVLVVSLVYGVAYEHLTGIDLSAGMDDDTYLLTQIFSWTFSIPFYIALFLYSRPANPIWNNSPGKRMQPDAEQPHR